MHPESLHDRRSEPRYRGLRLCAQLRLKGQLSRSAVEVLDFNRYGLAVRSERPLPKDQIVFLSLDDGEQVLDRVIGIVHNCLVQEGGYRCGIRFRTQSSLQFDRELVEMRLRSLERALAGRSDGG
ncbi:MAG: PilZ domain-containing protein [Pseudomonadales bacterium]